MQTVPMHTQSQINKEGQTTMYDVLINFQGNPSDVKKLEDEPQPPHFGAEWMLPLPFIDALPGKEGLIIGKSGNKLKEYQDKVNERYGGQHTEDWGQPWEEPEVIPAAVQAIWAKKCPDGMTVFTAYGRKPEACLQALQMIRDSAMKIMENHGWTVFPKYWRIAAIIKNFKHSNWSEEKEVKERWNTYWKRYSLVLEDNIRDTSTHGREQGAPYADWADVRENLWVWYSPKHSQILPGGHPKCDWDDPEIRKRVLARLQ